MRITEIFRSIQGESTRAGLPCTFVRLTGCPLRCRWCDTAYAFSGGTEMSEDRIVDRVVELGSDLCLVTGGEPLAQPDALRLLARLCDVCEAVALETSGAADIAPVDPRVSIVMDVKTPSSGETARHLAANLEHLRRKDEVKFVIADRADYEFSRDALRRDRLLDRAGTVLFSPVHGRQSPRDLAAWILADRLPVRLQLQLHKHIWDPDTRGV